MPVEFTTPLDFDSHEREVEIAVDPRDPALGTVRITLREVPHGKWVTLLATSQNASAARAKEVPALLDAMKAGTLSAEGAERLGTLIAEDERAALELVRWGVAGHKAEDFINRGASVPFVGEDAAFLGKPFRVASDVDLLLYRAAGKGTGQDFGHVLNALRGAVALFQAGRVVTPEEQWAPPEGAPEAP